MSFGYLSCSRTRSRASCMDRPMSPARRSAEISPRTNA